MSHLFTVAHCILHHQESLCLNCVPLSSPQLYDATVLAESYSGPELDILIDQGRDDQFLSSSQLLPDNLIAACSNKKIPVVFRLQQVSTEPTVINERNGMLGNIVDYTVPGLFVL